MEEAKRSLLGMRLIELKQVALELGMPAYTGAQIAKWLYEKHVRSIDEMTNISKENRSKLGAQFKVGNLEAASFQKSIDGTIKYLFPTEEGKFVETVYIPDGERSTLCVSSQVGCKMGCSFCMTGKQGFQGNLSALEIINQIYSLPESDSLTNIVFMGQGEPLDNFDEVLKAIEILTSDYGYAWSPKRITVSTVGLKKNFERLLQATNVHIAISLHSAIHLQRSMLMPAEKLVKIEEIIDILKAYDFSHQRRLSFEYIMFEGLNDSLLHAKKVKQLLSGLSCRVNLIGFHLVPGVELKPSKKEKMEAFRDYLTQNGIFTTIRASRGQDIQAACGLLTTDKKESIISL